MRTSGQNVICFNDFSLVKNAKGHSYKRYPYETFGKKDHRHDFL